MVDTILRQVELKLSLINEKDVRIIRSTKLSGGSINTVYSLVTDTGTRYCCKVNSANEFPGMFALESEGLNHLEKTKTFRTPATIAQFAEDSRQFLLLEWIQSGTKSQAFWKSFGKRLSRLHSFKSSSYGFHHNNYMGALAQSNQQHSEWKEFFFNERILPQVRLAADNQLLTVQQARLFDRLPAVLGSIFPDASACLLHGDLWSGNFLCDEDEQPVLIDPAVYYGHPAVDLGLTTLFGGFDPIFYDAYHYYNPFPANHQEQWECCNLYPLLVHLNLFGRSYLGDIMTTIQKY